MPESGSIPTREHVFLENGEYLTGWHWLPGPWGGGEWCYYFDDNGYRYTETYTPDGYRLQGGVWVFQTYVMNRRDGVIYYGATDRVYEESDYTADKKAREDAEAAKAVDAWFGYTPENVPKSSNDFLHGFYGQLTNAEKPKFKEILANFKETYIRDDMTDFEKEMVIIQWIVDHFTYEVGNVSAYQGLLSGKGQCASYADTFLQLGKVCGLDVRYVYNDNHAWNMIQLDGEWYHVDTTFEDQDSKSSHYGFGNLRNQYINLTDEEIKEVQYHHTWDAHGLTAEGRTYGPDAVAAYLKEHPKGY